MSPSVREVSVLIPARREEPYLGEAIRSAVGEGVGEVLVATEPDGPSAAIARAHGARVAAAPASDPDAVPRRNLAARSARGELLSFLDADDRFPAGRMKLMLGGLGDAVTGLVRSFASPDLAESARERLRIDEVPRPGLVSGAFVVRRDAFLSLGGFREEIASGEVAEWLRRAAEAGLVHTPVEVLAVERRVHGGIHLSRSPAAQASYLRLARERIERERAR